MGEVGFSKNMLTLLFSHPQCLIISHNESSDNIDSQAEMAQIHLLPLQ